MAKRKETKEGIEELKNLGRLLNLSSATMACKRIAIRKILIVFFCSTLFYSLFALWYVAMKRTESEMFWAFFILYVIIVLFCYLTIKHEISKYRSAYREGRGTLSMMVKIIDWTVFRKRQLYHTNDLNAIDDINRYISESQKRLSPVRDGALYYLHEFLLTLIILTTSLFLVVSAHYDYLKSLVRYAMDGIR